MSMVVNLCSSLPQGCKGSVELLKIELNRFLDIKEIEGYGDHREEELRLSISPNLDGWQNWLDNVITCHNVRIKRF